MCTIANYLTVSQLLGLNNPYPFCLFPSPQQQQYIRQKKKFFGFKKRKRGGRKKPCVMLDESGQGWIFTKVVETEGEEI